jgi:hypothetical protein
MSGYIYDYRQELDSNIWLMPPMYHRVWQWIKYNVNHSKAEIPNRDGSMTTIYPGQRATSYRQIAKGVGYYEGKSWKEPNVKTIKSILDWMTKQNMITVKGNTEGTIITVENWALYQSEKSKGNTKRMAQGTPSKHVMDTNNEGLINEEGMNNKKEVAYFDSLPLNNIMMDFIEHRKQIKKSMSDSAIKKLVEKVNKFNCSEAEKIKTLENSIINGWQGVFEPQPTKSTHQTTNQLKGATGSPNPTVRVPEW